MPTEYLSNTITATIPASGDAADIVTAFQSYHDDIANALVSKANVASPSFTTQITSPNVIATNNVTATANISGAYLISSTAYANVHTTTLLGQAHSAVRGARYYPSAAASYDPNNATVTQTRIIVSQNTPATANLVAGDIWISWTV